MPKAKKFWQFQNISSTKGKLLLYGNISTYSWWGDEVTPKQFQEDLDSLGDVSEIDVHINSPGGDVFAAQAIKSKLLQHKAKVTTIVDGWAASAGTIVLMAGDSIQVLPGSMVMAHDPSMGLMGYYQVQDLDAVRNALIKVKDSIIETYQAKTGKDREELIDIMSSETWMTATEAVDNGFADEVIHSGKLDIVENNNGTIVNGINFDMKRFKNASLPDVFLNTAAGGQQDNNKDDVNNEEDGEEIVNKDELKNKYPDIYNEVLEEGKNDERQRMKKIDDIALPGMDELVKNAKYDEPITAEQVAVKIINVQKEKGQEYLNQRKQEVPKDNKEVEQEEENKKEKEDEEAANDIADFINKKRGVIK